MRTLLSKLLIWLLLAVIILWSVNPLPALALGVTPGEFNFRVFPGGQCTRTLHVVNDGNQAMSYRIYADEKHESWFSISPEEVFIPPRQCSQIEITVAPPLTTIGKNLAFIYIVSTQPSSGLQVATGIKMRTNITVDILGYGLNILEDILPILIVVGAVIAMLMVFMFLVLPEIRRGRKG